MKSGPKRFLYLKNEMFMALMKMKTGLHMSIIGDLSGEHHTGVKYVFHAVAVPWKIYWAAGPKLIKENHNDDKTKVVQ